MVLFLFHVRVQCGFHAGAGRVWAGTMRGGAGAGCGAGYSHLVRVNSYGRGAGADQKFQPEQSSESLPVVFIIKWYVPA